MENRFLDVGDRSEKISLFYFLNKSHITKNNGYESCSNY